MVTTVEREKPPRRAPDKRQLLVAGTLIASIALIIAGARALGQGELEPTVPAITSSADPSAVLDARFVLQDYGALSHDTAQFWQDLTLDQVVSYGLPFTRYNRHYARFFLKEGETVEILVEADVPLGTSLDAGTEGISVMLIAGAAPYDPAHSDMYLPGTEGDNGGYFRRQERVGGNWRVGWAITALRSDYYWLIFTNTARQDAWCHYTVNVPSD